MTRSPEAIVRQWFQEVWDERREEAIDRLMAPDAKIYGLSEGEMVGPASFKPLYKTFCDAFADFKVEVVQTVVESNRVAALCHVTGRHAGDSLGCPATGRRVDFWGTTIVRVEDERIVEGWNTFDFLSMYQQVGVVPTPVV
jgi:steroid delta-isomerase-like uncharacterized protein